MAQLEELISGTGSSKLYSCLFHVTLHSRNYLINKYGFKGAGMIRTRIGISEEMWKNLSEQSPLIVEIITIDGEKVMLRDLKHRWYFSDDMVKDIKFAGVKGSMAILSYV
jgi:hypothetical protein